MAAIPPNDPKAPRWLLDLQEWKIVPYTEVPADILSHEGYGIVSYTWGYILDKANPASDPPAGLLWDVPGVTKWPLSKAREVMHKIGTRYIWWDWMCVPQRGKEPLSRELQEVQGQEIGKQLHIYNAATQSIVWLHSTSWSQESALRDLIRMQSPDAKGQDASVLYMRSLQSPEADGKDVAYMQGHVDQILRRLETARSEEWWLRSGWTLQEGVLLSGTKLIDGDGKVLSGLLFWSGGLATVSDISIPITRLAYWLAIGYFIKSQSEEPDVGSPIPSTAHTLSKAPETWLRRSLQTLLRSGLVGFWKDSPLYILSGKKGRTFGKIQDSCWALVGALDITDIEVTYDENVSMEEVKTRLLRALIDKYQWLMLLLAFPEASISQEEGQDVPVGRKFRWTDVVDGVMLPIRAFCVEVKDGSETSPESLPTLSYTDDLRMKGRHGKGISLCRPSAGTACRFRHYRQDKDGLKFVSTNETTFERDGILSNAWLFPIHDINMKARADPGRRCLVLLNVMHGSAGEPAKATFGGIIDIRSVEEETMEVGELILLASSP